MSQSLAKSRPPSRSRSRPRKCRERPGLVKSQPIDAATLASKLQLQEQQRDLIYSLLALAMKIGLLSLGVVSLFKLGLASVQRLDRYAELSSILNVESGRLIGLQKRFDRVFTIGGDRRLMDEQDQWIAPDRVRVIWR